MYPYDLVNNHYIILVDGLRCLIDTGSEVSYWVTHPIETLTIDGKEYPLKEVPITYSIPKATSSIGVRVDVLIGCDVILDRGLTIDKANRTIEFATREEEGTTVGYKQRLGAILIKVQQNGKSRSMIVDTAAKYGYGVRPVFPMRKPETTVIDYNPDMGMLMSGIYTLTLNVGDKEAQVPTCKNDAVGEEISYRYGAELIANVTDFFDEVFVLDPENQTITIR